MIILLIRHSSVIKILLFVSSHITEKAIRRRYGRSPRNVRAFVYQYNRLGHRGMQNLNKCYYKSN